MSKPWQPFADPWEVFYWGRAEYVASYTDLMNAFGTDWAAGEEHWHQVGTCRIASGGERSRVRRLSFFKNGNSRPRRAYVA